MALLSTISRWYFSKERLANTPSRKCNVLPDREEAYRQQAAWFIQDLGERLNVTQLCICTAIVYMQRFYMFHSFTMFRRNSVSAAAMFLATKVQDEPRRLDQVVKLGYACINKDQPNLVPLSSKCEQYQAEVQELVSNEIILLSTLGFDVAVSHPHPCVVQCCTALHLPREFTKLSYLLATSSLLVTTLCLRFSPQVVACVCIHLANSWSINTLIPPSNTGREWYHSLDSTVNIELIETLKQEFEDILEKHPNMIKIKLLRSVPDFLKAGVNIFSFTLNSKIH